MKSQLKLVTGLSVLIIAAYLSADASGDHDHHDDHAEKSEKHDHDEDKHDHEDEHEHEENASVGPDKGITEVNEAEGFKLSKEAIKNFELKTQLLEKAAPWTVPASAVLFSGEEVNLFRLRDGFYKRIDFVTDKKTPQVYTVRSKDLKAGDEVVIAGISFLRMAEIVSTGGAPEGHSH
jgi:ABC-type Zn2+ transport system, periplasmic component/surface adhesin